MMGSFLWIFMILQNCLVIYSQATTLKEIHTFANPLLENGIRRLHQVYARQKEQLKIKVKNS